MANGDAPRGLACPACGEGLAPPSVASDVTVLTCPRCGGTVRARRRNARSGEFSAPAAIPQPPPVKGMGLALRAGALRWLEWVYLAGLHGGAAGLLALGGFVPVLDGWLCDELSGWAGAVDRLGGVRVRAASKDPDADLGPVIERSDAPALFEQIAGIGRRLGARPPQQVRLTYLPCCGVTAWGRSKALIVGLPLLHVLNQAELRAVLAHELAHLARGDAVRAARATRFVEGLDRALDAARRPSRSPLRAWAQLCRRAGDALLEPVARGQEARADRAAAAVAGGAAAASALVKVALVQPLFREVLEHYDPANPALPNLYAFFRDFWSRLPDPVLTAMRHRLLASAESQPANGPHPGLLDRLELVQSYPDHPLSDPDRAPAATVLGDLDAIEQMLHNRVFAVVAIEPSVFHRAAGH
jgi:Zn-dependent protease with chaperone function